MVDTQVFHNETLEISFRLTNRGTNSGSTEVSLLRDGAEIDTKTVDLSPGETKTIMFTDGGPFDTTDLGDIDYELVTENYRPNMVARVIGLMTIDSNVTEIPPQTYQVAQVELDTGSAIQLTSTDSLGMMKKMNVFSDYLFVGPRASASAPTGDVREIEWSQNGELDLEQTDELKLQQ